MPKSKKGKGKKGKSSGPDPDCTYDVWINHVNKEAKQAGGYESNQNILDDCVDASTDEIRNWLIKNPDVPDTDPDPNEPKQYDKAEVREVLWKKVVLFYFAGRRQDMINGEEFTPILLEAYLAAKEAGKYVEVVYVPWDKKEAHFDEFFGEMPWWSIPHNDPQVKHLNAKFKVVSTPKLVICAQDGKVVTDDGIKKLLTQPNQFPYTKATSDNVFELASRRPNKYPCTVDQCKCKQYEGSQTGITVMEDGTNFRTPVLCNGCTHADIYHIPEPPDDKDSKKKDAPKKKKK